MEPYQYSMMYGLLGGFGNVSHANRAAGAWCSLSRAPRAAVREHANLGKPRAGWASSLHACCFTGARGLRGSELPQPPRCAHKRAAPAASEGEVTGGQGEDCSAGFLTGRMAVLWADSSAIHGARASPAPRPSPHPPDRGELHSRKFCSSSEISKEQKSPITLSLAPTTAELSRDRAT